MSYLMEHQEIYKGFHLVVMFVRFHRCGYLGLPSGHPLVGKDDMELNFEVHGGITYTESGEQSKRFSLNGFDWYIGFDCAHMGDGADVEFMKKNGVAQSTINSVMFLDGEVRTKEYVLEELYNLVEQITGC